MGRDGYHAAMTSCFVRVSAWAQDDEYEQQEEEEEHPRIQQAGTRTLDDACQNGGPHLASKLSGARGEGTQPSKPRCSQLSASNLAGVYQDAPCRECEDFRP